MVASQSTGECEELGNQECSEAGTFRLYGFRRINIVTLEFHLSDATRQRSWWRRTQHFHYIDQLFRCTSTAVWIPAYTQRVESTNIWLPARILSASSRHLGYYYYYYYYWIYIPPTCANTSERSLTPQRLANGSAYNINCIEAERRNDTDSCWLQTGSVQLRATHLPAWKRNGRQMLIRLIMHTMYRFNNIIWRAIKRA